MVTRVGEESARLIWIDVVVEGFGEPSDFMFITRTSPQDTYFWTAPSHAGHRTPNPEGRDVAVGTPDPEVWWSHVATSVLGATLLGIHQ